MRSPTTTGASPILRRAIRTAPIGDYDTALSLDAAYAMAYANRGMAHLAKGHFVQSLQDYDTAIEFDPAYAPAYTNRCWLFGFMGYGEAALADCDESLRLRPDDAFTLDARAFAFWLLEDRGERPPGPTAGPKARSLAAHLVRALRRVREEIFGRLPLYGRLRAVGRPSGPRQARRRRCAHP